MQLVKSLVCFFKNNAFGFVWHLKYKSWMYKLLSWQKLLPHSLLYQLKVIKVWPLTKTPVQ